MTAPPLKGARPLSFAKVDAIATAASEIAYEVQPEPHQANKRLIEQVRTLYRKDDLSGFSPLGQVESIALPGESYKLALTFGLLDIFQTRASPAELTTILSGPEAEYRDLDENGSFWIPSGQDFYSPNLGDSALQELAFARAHFFLPHRFQDPFGNTTTLAYDGKYNLAVVFTRDAVGNETTAEIDYRVLQPIKITDPNGNRAEARFDALGMLAGTALSGKATGPIEGDSFDDFATDVAPAQITEFFDSTAPRALDVAHLGTATTRIIYDLQRVPVCATSIARETHVSALAPGQQTKVQLHFVYSDGFGREAQTKVQAEPGPLDPSDPNSPVLDPRWVGTGAKIYNNKGKPVRQYEPFFSPTPQFGIEKWGVSNTLFYDPVRRVVATLHPNNTFEKVVFDPWRQTTYDANDTVTFDPKTDRDVGEFFRRLPDEDYLPTWYQQRINGTLGPDEKAAAEKAAKHANTPTIADFDSLGRTFLTIADNGKDANGHDQKYRTRTVLDIEGNQREVIDALDRVVMRYDYDILGTRLHQASMEAGERWMLNDVTGKPIRAWNSRQYAFRTEYDALHRPLKSFVQGGDPSEPNPTVFAQEILFERTLYGDSFDIGLSEFQQTQANLRGKAFRHIDGAGIVTTDLYDFKGNSLRSTRRFACDYKNAPDWCQNPALEAETFSSFTAYDALNRAIAVTAPDKSIYRPTFNEANLLEKVDVNLRGALANGQPVWTPFVTYLNYDAKGQRTIVRYANGAATAYDYDDKTFRLIHLKTTRAAGRNRLAAQIFKDQATVQDLRYTYDPVGNITRIEDAALQTVFHANHRVESASDYTYDPLYRLIEATGRENIGQSAFAFSPPDGNYRDYPFVGAAQLNDLQALRNYTEQYDYDPIGNFQNMFRRATLGNWTRAYCHDETSLIEPAKKSNRLSQTALQTNGNPPAEKYSYDAHGNITQMPHLPMMQWNFKDELSASSRQVVNAGAPETTYYVYDAGGQRTRKITERQSGARKNERIYLGGFEIYREFDAGGADALKRETLHVMDDKRRIALVETLTIDNGLAVGFPAPVQRFQLVNHLGSASLELDGGGGLISYEEYSPYGNTTYQAGPSAAEVSLKRYRYTGKERDEENGFYYCSARYQCSWLGRWINPDPKGIAGGLNLYGYASQSPVVLRDPYGRDPKETEKQDKKSPDDSKDKKTLQDEVDKLKEPATTDGKKQDDNNNKQDDKKAAGEASDPPQATSYLFTATQSADEETNRKVFEAMISQAVGKNGLGAAQLNAIWRTVWDTKAAGFRASVQKDTQSGDYNVSVGGIYHAWAKDESKSPVKVGLYVLPIVTYAVVNGRKATNVGASVVGAASADLSESTSLDLNATITGATSTQLTDNSTTLSPYGAFGLSAALTFKPGKGWQVPVEGSVTWASGPQSGATSTTSSTRFNAGIGVGKLGLLGLPFLGVYGGGFQRVNSSTLHCAECSAKSDHWHFRYRRRFLTVTGTNTAHPVTPRHLYLRQWTAAGYGVFVNAKDDSINFPPLLDLKANFPQLLGLISAGGASHSTNFSAASAAAATRTHFAQSAVQFMTQNGFDGIDIDWEFPEATDSVNFTALLHELRSQLDAREVVDGRRYLLTIAAPAGPSKIANLQLSLIHPLLDWINLMTYDFSVASSHKTNFNAPLFTHKGALNVDAAVEQACRPTRSSWAYALSAPAGRESGPPITGSIRRTRGPRRGPGICQGQRQAAVSATKTSRTTTSPATRAAGTTRRKFLGSITPALGS